MRLTPCPNCARHVRQDAGDCPFCDHTLPHTSSARAKVGAMLVGAAAVSTLTGCPRPMMKYGGPPAPVEQRDPNEPEAIDTPADEESPPSEAPDGDEVPASEPA